MPVLPPSPVLRGAGRGGGPLALPRPAKIFLLAYYMLIQKLNPLQPEGRTLESRYPLVRPSYLRRGRG